MSREITKHGTIKSVDSDRRIAHGVALVPNEVDHQGDWLKASAIERLSDDYMQRLSAGEADQGVMHVKFEESDISLAESRVLDSPAMIGGEQYPAGTWELGFKIHDSDLWNLVAGENPVLSGFSIGGAVDFGAEQSAEDLPPDVTVPEDVELAEQDVTEIIDGTLREVSLVDLPAVPRARVATIKSLADLEKAIDPSMTHDEIVEQLDGRGLDESQRARLASYLKKTVATTEDETTRMSTQTAGEGDSNLDEEATSFYKRMKQWFSDDEGDADETEKVGRTLRDEIQERLRIAHDEIESSLAAEDDQFKPNRFTDDQRYSTNIDEKAKAADLSPSDELDRAITDLKTAKSLAILKQDVDPDAGTPEVGDAVRWESSAGGENEPADVRYGVVVDGLEDGDEGEVLVAVYQPTEDGDGWENRGEENPMSVDNLEPIGSDGVGSLPPVDSIKAAHTFNEPAESGADGDTTDDMTDKSLAEKNAEELAEIKDLLKSDTDDDEAVENPDDSTRADGVEAEGDGDSPEVEDGTRADGVEQEGEPDSGETEDGTRADGVDEEDVDADEDDEEKSRDEPPEWATELSEAVQSNRATIESLAKASGYSQQLAADATKAGDGEDDEVDEDARKAQFLGFAE